MPTPEGSPRRSLEVQEQPQGDSQSVQGGSSKEQKTTLKSKRSGFFGRVGDALGVTGGSSKVEREEPGYSAKVAEAWKGLKHRQTKLSEASYSRPAIGDKQEIKDAEGLVANLKKDRNEALKGVAKAIFKKGESSSDQGGSNS